MRNLREDTYFLTLEAQRKSSDEIKYLLDKIRHLEKEVSKWKAWYNYLKDKG